MWSSPLSRIVLKTQRIIILNTSVGPFLCTQVHNDSPSNASPQDYINVCPPQASKSLWMPQQCSDKCVFWDCWMLLLMVTWVWKKKHKEWNQFHTRRFSELWCLTRKSFIKFLQVFINRAMWIYDSLVDRRDFIKGTIWWESFGANSRFYFLYWQNYYLYHSLISLAFSWFLNN